MTRAIFVSNRLPVTVGTRRGVFNVAPSTGGLATGLSGPHALGGGTWIGWPGPTWDLSPSDRARLDARLAELRLAPVELSRAEVERYYEGWANGLLWPLFHSLLDQAPIEVEGWEDYQRVNQRFAQETARRVQPGDSVWIHDYQLLLVPGLLRELVPGARIGFFLHIPFPATPILRALPHREELLRGLLGADLVGFHTPSYARHFASALQRILGLEVGVDRVRVGRRDVRISSFPMGVDAREFEATATKPAVIARAKEIRGGPEQRLLVGIDRLDYTKGIRRRLASYEKLLETRHDLHGRVHLVQVAVPSRSSVRAYREVKSQVDALVGRIQGRFSTPTWTPIRYVHRGLARDEIVALYLAADVLVVTPVRDGMNLVAKEFAASRPDEDGVLVLSEFAGAASELAGAVLVNPYDVEGTAKGIAAALDMPREERHERMRLLRARVASADVHGWARKFLAALAATEPVREERLDFDDPADVARAITASPPQRTALLLDYDGTLVDFTARPEDARPDAELLELLARLAVAPGLFVHLVSGRPREDLEQWFGRLPVALHAEHGLWARPRGTRAWSRRGLASLPSGDAIAAILEDFAARTPGAFVERKTSVLAWHWRSADPAYGERQSSELRQHLAELFSNVPVEVLVGDHVVEVRPHGVHKGLAAAEARVEHGEGARLVGFGDDRTDEDLFAALGPGDVAVHVGPRASSATLRLANAAAARAALVALLRGG
ncbi:MAG: bifunctional alpha,alpha-trehalose-phosphate synthase (UDP-forming)/trehalose-phosphatase [Planctomycetes bacterium]|nr:bifunctional alpha,alpha-trehalose-phosphate synthase (UDP-forming)/trehalose-phosphatase [Planctomycetota bacterium]